MKISIPRISVEAWVLSDQTNKAIRGTYSSRHMIRIKSSAIKEGEPSEIIRSYADTATPDLLIVETSLDETGTAGFIEDLKKVCSPKTRVIIIGRNNNVRFYQAMMSEGISEYMLAPVTEEQVIETIGKIYHTAYAENTGRLIAFYGAAGGVGSSTLAQNTAWASAELHDHPTLLVDLDVGFGTVQLNLAGPEGGQDISSALFDSSRVEETFVAQIIAKLTNRLEVLQSPATLDRPLDFDQEVIDKMMDVVRHSSPLSIIDMPRNWSRWTHSTLSLAEEVVIVTQPDIVGLRNTKNVIQTLQNLRRDTVAPRYVINMSGVQKRTEVKTSDFVEAIGTQPLAVIPHEAKAFSMAAMEGKTVVHSETSPALTKIFNDIAGELIGTTGLSQMSTRLQTKGRVAALTGTGIGGLLGRFKKSPKIQAAE